METYLTSIPGAAKALAVSKSTIRRLLEAEELVKVTMDAGYW